ncbi:MAG TPA: S4 domain-containing protein, partial [Vicinamibacterales bacterium]|nr:S4 domain-containing protein [Vicinamibacterales bacterium]
MNREPATESQEPKAESRSFTLPAEFNGQRLDRVLVSLLGDYSRSQIQRLISDHQVDIQRDGPKGP